MSEVTQSGIDGMDDMAAWSQKANTPRPVEAPRVTATQMIAAAIAAKRVRDDVGRYMPGLEYVPAYLDAIREHVTVGFSYTPAEPGDDEQPEIGECFEIQEVWLRGVNIGPLFSDEQTDKLIDAIKAGAKGAW